MSHGLLPISGIVIVFVIIIAAVAKIFKINWQAFAAVVTLFAVIWAVYSQDIKNRIDSPILEFSFFERASPHLSRQVQASVEKTGDKEYYGLFITIRLTNTGETVAHNAQVFLTKWGYKNEDNSWKVEDNWIDIPLKWVLETEPQIDLIPQRPYLFNIGSFSNVRNGQFLFTYLMSNKGQKELVPHGEYCFEITAFAQRAATLKKYFYIKFEDFKNEVDLKKIENYVHRVEMKDYPPW